MYGRKLQKVKRGKIAAQASGKILKFAPSLLTRADHF
jgi:hypothetical protein